MADVDPNNNHTIFKMQCQKTMTFLSSYYSLMIFSLNSFQRVKVNQLNQSLRATLINPYHFTTMCTHKKTRDFFFFSL